MIVRILGDRFITEDTDTTTRSRASLAPLFKGGEIANRPVFWHYPHYGNQGGEPCAIIRKGDWKLIHYDEDGRDELYQLSKDIGEQNDLAGQNLELAQSLRKGLDADYVPNKNCWGSKLTQD